MGNPRLNPTEKAELQVLPNREAQGPNSDSRMREEAYAPKDFKETKERVQVSAMQVAQLLDSVINHLENAETPLTQNGAHARTEYAAAIASADKIDQTGVAREIRNIKLLLQNQKMDPQTRRLLVQEDADLQTLQRAPGFTRANMALALIRNGDQASGTQLLLDAQQRDRAMNGDPNFQRHFKNALDDAANHQKASYTFDQRDAARPPTQPARDVLQPPELQPRDAPKPESNRPTAGTAAAALTDVERKFQQVVQQKGDVRGAYQQLVPEFQAAIGKADAEFTALNIDDQEKMRGALMGRFLTRFCLADAAAIAGDRQNGQAQLGAAFEAVPPEMQKYYATQKPEVQALANKVGIDLRLLPAPPDAILSGALQSTPRGRTDASRQVSTTDDAAQPPVAGISSENQGLRADQIFDDAKRSLQQGGMTEATKKLFADAIKVADSMYGPADQQTTDKLINSLQTGRKADGSAITSDERLETHKVVQQEFSRATWGMQYRMVYGQALNQNKQYASAEKVFKENIAITDRLPLVSFQAELTQLGKDVQNPNINRNSQRDLFNMMQAIQGQGTSKDDGLLFMPITSRKHAALFYVGGADGSGSGIVKPEQAAAMIDDAIAKEKSLYGVDKDKVKGFDPTLANMAQGIIPLLPENLRKTKMQTDTFWSNALVDGGVAAAAISGTMFIAGVLTKNGTLAKMGLASAEGTLNFGGKALVGASILGGATLGRHEVHKLITGENESWDNSLIHGTAGVGGVAAIMGTRSLANKILYGGAGVTPETMLTRFSTERSVAALGGGAATTPTVGEFFVNMGSNGRLLTAEQAALKASVAPLVEGGIVNSEAAAALKSLTQPQLATLTQTFLKESVAGGSHWYSPSNIYGAGKPLDLTTTSSANLGARSFYSGYTSAFSAIGTYSSISSLDRAIDPKTGKPISYADSFIQSNYRNAYENTAVDALWMGILMRDGALAKNIYAEGASPASKAWGYFKAPLKPSALGIGALGDGASYGQMGLKAAQIGVISTLANGSNLKKWYEGGMEARAIGHQLDAMQEPITDQSAPQARARDTSVLNPASEPAGQTDAPATPMQDNGQPIQDQQTSELTRGTPGL